MAQEEIQQQRQQPGQRRDPITCHCLNTVTGQPAASMGVHLSLFRGPEAFSLSSTFKAHTDADGRVTKWGPAEPGTLNLHELFHSDDVWPHGKKGELVWILRFQAGDYFGHEGWWDDIEIRFRTNLAGARDHWHVPLLLSPWSYTTYRGS